MAGEEIVTATYTPTEIRGIGREDLFLKVPGTLARLQNLTAGTAVGKISASGLLKAYDNDNQDGSEVCVGLLSADVDATLKNTVCAVYVKGVFVEALLTGLDAEALADLGARSALNGLLLF